MSAIISPVKMEQIGRAIADYAPKAGHRNNFLLNEATLPGYKEILSKILKDKELESFVDLKLEDLKLEGKKLTLTLIDSKNETLRFIITVGKDKAGKNFTKIEYGGGNIQPFEKVFCNLWISGISSHLNQFFGRVGS